MDGKCSLDGVVEKFEEPLFVLALIAAILPALRFILPAKSTVYMLLPHAFALMGLLSAYFTYLYLKKEKNFWVIGIPALVFGIALFMQYSNSYAGVLVRDFNVFALSAGFMLLFYTLMAYKLIDWRVAVVLAIFSTTLITHVIPAKAPFLAALDPYWHFKFAKTIVDTGYIPEHDKFVYPLWGGRINPRGDPPGIDFSSHAFFNSVFMAVIGLVLKPLGFTALEAAILYPGVVSAFTVVLVYLLVVALFAENKPYNHVAGILAAFMVMFSPAFAAKSIATNAEDDAIGMMLMVSSFFLFIQAYRKRNLKFTVLAAISFMLLSMTWGGYTYAVIVMGAFAAIYALVSYLKNEDCIGHIIYLLAALVPAQLLVPFILHPRGGLPQLTKFIPDNFFIVGIGGAVLFSLILEAVRIQKHGKQKAAKGDDLAVLYNLIEENIYAIGLIILLVVAGLVVYIGPQEVYSFILWKIIYAKTPPYLIGRTIAEQNPLATSISSFLAGGTNRFGVSLMFGIFMILPLLYMGFKKRNLGAIFVLCWSLPMMYGAYNKSQFLFAASVPISVLGATVGLFSVAKKKDLETLRVIGLILLLSTPFIYIPFGGSWNYNKFLASVPMSMGVSGDRYYWDSALEWLRTETPENSGVLTWWDYGHWITSVSQRYVLIDNLQADHYQIQDIARFFVNATSEGEAFKAVKAYQDAYSKQGVDLRYVVIDWTMVGKGSALHYIATGTIDPFIEGSWKNYAHCSFAPQFSDTSPKILPHANGTVSYVQDLVFGCTNYIPAVKFRVSNNRISEITVLDKYGGEIPWNSWVREHDASLLGLYPPGQIIGLAKERPFDSILPTLRSFVYVPGEFNDFMMTRLYLGGNLEAYQALGLYNRNIKPLRHFKQIQDFAYGFVRVYEIIDEPGEDDNATYTGSPLFDSSSNPPRISITPSTKNLGDVSVSGGVITSEFNITNKGSGELVIMALDTSCMCTSASIIVDGVEGPRFEMRGHTQPSGFSAALGANKTVQLKVYYDPTVHPDLRGPVSRTVNVYSNDPQNPRASARINLNQQS